MGMLRFHLCTESNSAKKNSPELAEDVNSDDSLPEIDSIIQGKERKFNRSCSSFWWRGFYKSSCAKIFPWSDIRCANIFLRSDVRCANIFPISDIRCANIFPRSDIRCANIFPRSDIRCANIYPRSDINISPRWDIRCGNISFRDWMCNF